MAADASAYAALGLEPGADAAAIEQAYRRLIKQHHPDRAGGDARRAAEINRAYRELRLDARLKDPLELNEDCASTDSGSAVRVARNGALSQRRLLLISDRLARWRGFALRSPRRPSIGLAKPRRRRPMRWIMPLIRRYRCAPSAMPCSSPGSATKWRSPPPAAIVITSFEQQPEPVQLDRCAAFDDAVVQLQDRDPLRDQRAFQRDCGDRPPVERRNGLVERSSGDRRPARSDPAARGAGLAPTLGARATEPATSGLSAAAAFRRAAAASAQPACRAAVLRCRGASPDSDHRRLSEASNFST